MDEPTTDRITLPDVIARYQDAHDRLDSEAAIAGFAPGATVLDDGHAYVGHEQIRSWLDHAASEYTFTRTLLGVEDAGDGGWVVRNRLEGNFPGGTVDLAYQFTVRDDLIAHLQIAP